MNYLQWEKQQRRRAGMEKAASWLFLAGSVAIVVWLCTGGCT